MRSLLHKLFGSKQTWSFEKAGLIETTEPLKNPARGWYTIYPFFAEEEPDFEKIAWCRESSETLALVIINIGYYREQQLDVQALNRIRSILDYFKRHAFNIILRLTYDHEGKAVEREPFFFKQVVEHLEQLTSVIKEFSDVIFVSQGMLIGNWGEMHTSRFIAPDKLRLLWGMLQSDLQKEPYLAVRRPSMWRILHPESCGKLELRTDSTGLFDDAIFGSMSHMGTFGTEPKENVGWDGIWSREEELEFEDKLCKAVPNGGEVVCGETYAVDFSPSATVEVLKKMHITYLNQAYDTKILRLWKQWRWTEDGPWQDYSLYDYIGAHLGYRFTIRDVRVFLDEQTEEFKVRFFVENVGFANCYQELVVRLVGREEGRELFSMTLNCDARGWESGTVQRFSARIEYQNCELYLSARRKKDGKRVYFANPTEEDGRVYLGRITGVQ